MPIVPEFPDYDPELAELAKTFDQGTGLPGFLGIEVVEVGAGTMRCVVDARPDLQNPFGMLHGGVVSALVDHVLGAVCYPVIPRGAWAATTEYKLNLLAPVREGPIVAEASIEAMSRRTAVVRVDVHNGGRIVALAQGTVTIQPPKG